MTIMISVTTIWILAATAVVASVELQGASTDPCELLQCANGAQCVLGEASFVDHPTTEEGPMEIHKQNNINGFHCECLPGWTGLKCDIVFDSCSDSHKCYHGGRW